MTVAIVHHRVLEPGICLLQKPLTPESMLRKVREVLDNPRTERMRTFLQRVLG